MKKILIIITMASALLWSGCDALYQVMEESGTVDPTTGEMSGGIKQALNSGINMAVTTLGKPGGFSNDPLIRIPFPQEAQFAANTLRDIGLGQLVDEFELKLNKGAEEGVKKALPIFGNAIKQMTFNDVKGILLGGENAATDFFKAKTSAALFNAFSPKIKGTLDEVGANKVWTELTTRYNSIPLTRKKVETDLVKYATNKAMDGLFLKVAEQESLIRKDPVKRTSDLLKKVFSYADRQKAGGN